MSDDKLPYKCVHGHDKFPINECPNMKPVKGDTSMRYEHYRCEVCGRRESLDYEEMR